MKARQVMTRDVRCVLPETSLAEAWRLMHEHGMRHLPVVRDGRLVGLVSDRDFLGFVAKAADGSLVFSNVTVGRVMSTEPIVAVDGAPVSELARTMVSHAIDSLPIVADGGLLVGLVTSTDLLVLLLEVREPLGVTYRIRPEASA
jgi:acetoin utilization protein AcuB